MSDLDVAPSRRGVFGRLYHGETSVNFVGRRRIWFVLSLIVIAAGVASLATRGLNLGFEFEGGSVWEVQAGGLSVAKARDALAPVGQEDATIQIVGDDTLRVQADVAGDNTAERERSRQEVSAALAELAGVPVNEVSVQSIGPSWGEEITEKAQRALVFFLVAITIYITLRFEWKMALATLAALFHDILVTVGVYSLTGFEVTPATVIALLTILGYSIYDGIVVFDKVDENTRGLAASGRMTYGDMVNLSLNQVLMRTLNTSITALLPILSLLIIGSYILGATTLQEFALALLIGLGASAYSSIFIASPLLALLKEREPRYASIRDRLGGRSVTLTPAAAAAGAGLSGDERPVLRPGSGGATAPTGVRRPPPRPRKKGRRR